jgi:SAM-dependent methyltransferase
MPNPLIALLNSDPMVQHPQDRGRPAYENPFANPVNVTGYEAWYESTGRRADRLEKALLKRLLAGFPQAHSMLEIGSGTGHFTRWFRRLGFQAVGLDLSPAMLAEAVHLDSSPSVLGDGLALSFPPDTFDLVALVTTLEFVSDPVQVLREAVRVARAGLILGVLNRHSLLTWQLRRSGSPVWQAARFFTPADLVQLVRQVAGDAADILWRTTLWPLWPGDLPWPWGGFIGIAVKLRKDGGSEDDRYCSPGESISIAPGASSAGD